MLTMMTTPASPAGHPSASVAAVSSQGVLGLPQWRADFIASANMSERDQSETSSRLTPSRTALPPSRAFKTGASPPAQQLKPKRSTPGSTSVLRMLFLFEPSSFMHLPPVRFEAQGSRARETAIFSAAAKGQPRWLRRRRAVQRSRAPAARGLDGEERRSRRGRRGDPLQRRRSPAPPYRTGGRQPPCRRRGARPERLRGTCSRSCPRQHRGPQRKKSPPYRRPVRPPARGASNPPLDTWGRREAR